LAIERLTAAYRVSRREFGVLRLVSVGRTNREIAKALFVSPRTVDMHVSNLLMKLGCRSRTEATHRAAELGLLDNNSERFAQRDGPRDPRPRAGRTRTSAALCRVPEWTERLVSMASRLQSDH
jgi:DNA-binding CsgD family transcriptional regulator